MIRITLTDFVDFLGKNGPAQLTKVRQIKTRPDYHPNQDHYKYLRDGICRFHSEGHPDKNAFFRNLIDNSGAPKKRESFTALAEEYKKFLGRKVIVARPRAVNIWTHRTLEVSVNPELNLDIGGEKHLIKLYFKKDPIAKNRVDAVLYLMQTALPSVADIDKYSILDIRHNRFISESSPDATLGLFVRSQADAFITMHDGV